MTLNDPKFHAKTSIVHDMYPRPAWRVMGWGGGGGGGGGSCNFDVKIKIALIPV